MLLHLTSNTAPSSPFRISVFSIMAFTAIYSLTYVFIAIFGCSPVAAAWDIRIEAGKCIDKTAYAYAYGGCNILSSWAIFGLGLVVCLRNRLIRRRVGREVRWCLGIVLAVGCLYVFTPHPSTKSVIDGKQCVHSQHNPSRHRDPVFAQ